MKKFDSILTFCAWTYLTGTLAALALMYLTGDRWWPGTLLLFGPRWMLALPLIPLLPLALWRIPRLLLPIALGGLITFGPFMGFRYPLTTPERVGKGVVRVLTCNIGGKDFDSNKLSKLIRDLDVDLVSLQECPRELKLDLPPGWHSLQPGGLAIFSKFPLKEHTIVTGMHLPDTWPRASLLPSIVSTPYGDISFNAIHLPTARFGIMHMLDRKYGINIKKKDVINKETKNRIHISQKAREVINKIKLPTIIAGDFNMTTESIIYRNHWGDLSNAFSKTGKGYGWSTENSIKRIRIKTRIDHILSQNNAAILTVAIGKNVKSDHLPVIADISY
jgi:endonuclease/exonuclease/phosphatase family metal-dependent hydrolase